MAAPRMAPLTPNNVMANGPMQQILDATLVSAADEAPVRAPRFSPKFGDAAIVQKWDNPAATAGSLETQNFWL